MSDLAHMQSQLQCSREQTERYKKELYRLRQLHMEVRGMVYRSSKMIQVVSVANEVAAVDSTVLITGESGTGKELIANHIHLVGKGDKQPFIKINCAALPESLLESELFGYEAGAFTNAQSKGKPGLFELAHGGSLFLDELGDMPPFLQLKLLRVLQEKEIMRLGATRPVKVEVRIIAATNRNLQEMVNSGKFRGDLFYRLMVVPIHLPPLRERKEDIPALVSHFVANFNKKFNRSQNITVEAVDIMMEYPWPGNIRELENVVEWMMVLNKAETLSTLHLPEKIQRRQALPQFGQLKQAVAHLEKHMLGEARRECGSWEKAAQKLGINTATAYRKAGRYGLDSRPSKRNP
jgi:transcriptional regulator with PAS, ATPase and Fis domain